METGRALSTPPSLKAAEDTIALVTLPPPSALSHRENTGESKVAVSTEQTPISSSAQLRQPMPMGVSSSQSSGAASRVSSSSSSSSSSVSGGDGGGAASVTAAPASTALGPSPDPTGSGRATLTPAPLSGCSPPLLDSATSTRALPERGNRRSRRCKGGRYGSGSSGTLGSGAGTSEVQVRYPRTAFDRCKAARAIAVRWMSQLMQNPPEASWIGSARAAHLTKEEADGGAQGQVNRTTPPPTPCKQSASEPGAASGCPNGVSVPEAVVHPKSGGTTATTPPTAAAAVLSSDATTPALSSTSGGPEGTSPPSGASSRVHYESLEIVPKTRDSIPPLLHALREIALSCASLDALGKASHSGAAEEGGPRRKSKGGSHPKTPSAKGTASALSSSLPNSSPAAAPMDEEALVTRSRELYGEYEAQWGSVRSHLAAVRSFTANERELVEALDAALGEEWRAEVRSGSRHKEEHEGERGGASPAASDTVAMGSSLRPSADEEDKVAVALNSAAVAAASPLSRLAKEYVPRDCYLTPPTAPVALASIRATSPDQAAAVAATSTLNSNAEPFHTRFAANGGGGSGGAGGSPSLLDSIGNSGNGPSHHADPGGIRGHRKATGGKGATAAPVYSPSQAVTSYLERVSLSPRPGLINGSNATVFPSTPPCDDLKTAGSRDEATPGTRSGNDSGSTSPSRSPVSTETAGGVSGGDRCPPQPPPATPSGEARPTGDSAPTSASASASAPAPTFRLESREDMLRRRSAAPSAFYAATAHYFGSGGGHHSSSSSPSLAVNNTSNAIQSAATTPVGLHASSPGGLKHGAGGMNYMSAGGGGGVHGPRSLPVSPVLSYSTPVLAPQCPYDYILVIDFEATCEEHPPRNYLYEIIEFPVVLVDVHLQRAVAEFHRFVKPRHKAQLSAFCKELTGIQQSNVDEAASLEEVILQFERWYHQTLPPNARTVFATDGPMDFKEFMHQHSVLRQQIRFPTLFYQWIDVKKSFAQFFQCQQGKIKAMLEVLHCPFEGRLHSGIDDARNIARIVIGLLQWGCTFCDVPLSRIDMPSLGNANSAAATTTSARSTASLPGSLPFGSPLHLPPSTNDSSGHHFHSD